MHKVYQIQPTKHKGKSNKTAIINVPKGECHGEILQTVLPVLRGRASSRRFADRVLSADFIGRALFPIEDLDGNVSRFYLRTYRARFFRNRLCRIAADQTACGEISHRRKCAELFSTPD